MEAGIVCRMRDTASTLRFEALRGWKKVRGLLGTDRDAGPVALCGCASIHTVGMRYPIDVALVTRGGLVLRSRRAVVPGRLVSAAGAYYALERPSAPGPWPSEGSWIGMASVGE